MCVKSCDFEFKLLALRYCNKICFATNYFAAIKTLILSCSHARNLSSNTLKAELGVGQANP